MGRQAGHASGQEASASADLEHAVLRLELKRLQHPAFHHRLHHHFAMAQGQAQVGKSQVPVGRIDEILARDAGKHVQDAHVQYFPGAHLVLHHVGAGLFEIHRHGSVLMRGKKV